jgi:hypothetical protein
MAAQCAALPNVTQLGAACLAAIRPLERIDNLFQLVAYIPNNIIHNALFQ